MRHTFPAFFYCDIDIFMCLSFYTIHTYTGSIDKERTLTDFFFFLTLYTVDTYQPIFQTFSMQHPHQAWARQNSHKSTGKLSSAIVKPTKLWQLYRTTLTHSPFLSILRDNCGVNTPLRLIKL